MNIPAKWAKKGFKIYSLCAGNYLLAFLFSSKTTKVEGVKQLKLFSLSSTLVINLCKLLSKLWKYVLYIDNFFTNVKLLKYLKGLDFKACETAKAGSEISRVYFKFKKSTIKKSDWENKICTNVDEKVLYAA